MAQQEYESIPKAERHKDDLEDATQLEGPPRRHALTRAALLAPAALVLALVGLGLVALRPRRPDPVGASLPPFRRGLIIGRAEEPPENEEAHCPEEAPEPFSKCSASGQTCSYGPVECPDGSKHYSTRASCDGEWAVMTAMVECPPKSCCRALKSDCMACAAGVSEEDFCDRPGNAGIVGCPAILHARRHEPRRCCRAFTSKCLSCVMGVDEDEYCSSPGNAGILGCPEILHRRRSPPRRCCRVLSAECMACVAGVSEEAYCSTPGNAELYDCPGVLAHTREEPVTPDVEGTTQDIVVEPEVPVTTPRPRPCCKALTADCMSCAAGLAVEDYCAGAGNAGIVGCPEVLARALPRPCCLAMSPTCLACSTGQTVEEYCAVNPGKYGCPELPSRCPPSAPRPLSNCSEEELHGATCGYGKVSCPDGSEFHSIHAVCAGSRWMTAMARVECPPTRCCMDATAECQACLAGLSTQEFCSAPDHKGVVGCSAAACPDVAPKPGDPCEGAPSGETACKYDRLTCPDGSEHYTTIAQCDDERWSVAMAMVMCPQVLPVLTAACPDHAPEALSPCSAQLANKTCSYGQVKCPDGHDHFSTFAECTGKEWTISAVDVACGHDVDAEVTACPPTAPATGMPCPGYLASDVSCKYDKVTCPNQTDTERWATVAQCYDRRWSVMTSTVACGPP